MLSRWNEQLLARPVHAHLDFSHGNFQGTVPDVLPLMICVIPQALLDGACGNAGHVLLGAQMSPTSQSYVLSLTVSIPKIFT